VNGSDGASGQDDVVLKEKTAVSAEDRLAAVETKVQCVSADSDDGDFILRGCNVHVQNGAADTLSVTQR
jgi:hypothetical protein